MANIPLILAGPVVRRVTPLNVSIWVALSSPANVRLSIWNKQILAGPDHAVFDETSDPPLSGHTASTNTSRFGEKLHISVVSIELPLLDALLPGEMFSYNLTFQGIGADTTVSDLKSNGLLVDQNADADNLVAHLALGYKPGFLPTFVLPPLTLDELNLVHGSCRKAHGYGKDSLAALDTVIEKAVLDDTLSQRIHQLYFTGDQIYADEIPISMTYYINQFGTELIGTPEQIEIEKTMLTATGERVKDAQGHDALGEPRQVAVTLANFPPSRRQRIIKKNGRLTTDSMSDDPTKGDVLKAVGINHLISFGEFCATYLLYWSNTSWNYVFNAYKTPDLPRLTAPWTAVDLTDLGEALFDLRVLEFWKTDELSDTETALCPRDVDEKFAFFKESDTDKIARQKRQYNEMRDRCKEELGDFEMFISQIPRVRRLLANTAVYMIFDDHEVADDWNATREWREKVYGCKLGRSMVRNAMAAYTVFQDWGNVASSYASGNKSELLIALQDLFKNNAVPGPDLVATAKLDVLFGLNLTDESAPPVKWHYSVPCGETTVYVLDTRTRRTFPTRNSPPGLLTADAMDDQIPIEPGPERAVIFVSPAPVLGLGALELLLQPMMILFTEMEADPEAWALNQPALEAFLARVQIFKKVVFLSGDVHYGISTEMTYWELNDPTPSRIVQLVSSSLKNEKLLNSKFMISSMVQHVLGSLFYPGERLGWNIKAGLQITNELNKPYQPVQRIALRKEPILLNAKGWPENTEASREPDWRWILKIIRDIREDIDDGIGTTEERPLNIRVAAFNPDVDPANGVAEAYAEVLGKHVTIHTNSVPRCVAWNSNIGLVKFTSDASGNLTVYHKLLYWLERDSITLPPDYYTVFSALLKDNGDLLPELRMV